MPDIDFNHDACHSAGGSCPVSLATSQIAGLDDALTEIEEDITDLEAAVAALGNSPVIKAANDLTGQSATVASVTTFTVGGSNGGFRVGAYIVITAISAGTVTMSATYTDENNVPRTANMFPMGLTSASLTATGAFQFSSFELRAKASTAITVVATFVGVSVAFDVGGTIEQLR